MSDTPGDYFPTFEKGEIENQYYVTWRGARWGLLTPIQDSWTSLASYGFYVRRSEQVELSFTMVRLPPEPNLTIPDHIVLGEN